MFASPNIRRPRMADRVGENPRLGFRERGTRELTAFASHPVSLRTDRRARPWTPPRPRPESPLPREKPGEPRDDLDQKARRGVFVHRRRQSDRFVEALPRLEALHLFREPFPFAPLRLLPPAALQERDDRGQLSAVEEGAVPTAGVTIKD